MAFVGEVFRISLTTLALGLVVNLYRDASMHLVIAALLLDPTLRVAEGAKVKAMSRLPSITLGDFAIGSLLDPIGNFIMSTGSLDAQHLWVIEAPAPGIIDRQSVFEPLQTGVMCVDAIVPVGRGQRELIVGDRQTGKTSLGVDAILNQKYEKVFCVYSGLGAGAGSILEVFLALVRRGAMAYAAILVASAASSACSQFLAAYTGAALAEFFALVGELSTLVIYDDLSRHAVAYREIYLLLRRPPGREAYPGEIFFVHSRLLERGVKLSTNLGAGSVSAFPVIETLAADVSAYITTNVISITDGQIFLSTDLFLTGIKPAIDVGLSVTRVGSAAQWDGMKLVAGSYKLELAQFIELQAFSQFAADLGEETKARLARGRRFLQMLIQPNGSPMGLSKQISILSLAQHGILEALDLKDVAKFVGLYLSVPTWAALAVPARLVGRSLVRLLHS
jgi:F-type H+-transporting ATPase subunit alpha